MVDIFKLKVNVDDRVVGRSANMNGQDVIEAGELSKGLTEMRGKVILGSGFYRMFIAGSM